MRRKYIVYLLLAIFMIADFVLFFRTDFTLFNLVGRLGIYVTEFGMHYLYNILSENMSLLYGVNLK